MLAIICVAAISPTCGSVRPLPPRASTPSGPVQSELSRTKRVIRRIKEATRSENLKADVLASVIAYDLATHLKP